MEVLYPRAAGLDIHKDTIVACRVVTSGSGPATKEVQTFGATTSEILRLGDWLREAGVTHAAMESTGVYWKPIWNVLDDEFTLLLVNARHVKAVPGRKTDVKDAEWLADLLRHGLLQPSFVPDRPQRELRELVRYRTSLVQARSREANRIQKTLEGANLKLGSVASDVLGVSGRAILTDLAAGVTDPSALADHAKGKLRRKRADLEAALIGRISPHLGFMLSRLLDHIEFLDGSIETVEAEIAERVGPFEEFIVRLDGLPGVGRQTAELVVAEIGGSVASFPTHRHLAAWAGLCPGNNESAGKHKRSRLRPGNRSLRHGLIEAANAAARKRGTYYRAQYLRLKPRLGHARARSGHCRRRPQPGDCDLRSDPRWGRVPRTGR